MRHCTGANFAGLDFLLEILHRDVHPEIAVEVDNNCINATDCIEHTTHLVVIGYLGGVLLTLKSQFLADKAIAELSPIIVGISHMVGIEVSRCTTELCRHGHLLQRVQLLLQTIDEHHDFLSQPGR